MYMRYVYGVIAFICMITGIMMAVRSWSLWSIAWIIGAIAVGLIIQFIVGLILKDPSLGR